jgi:hypothetical protein
MDKLLPNIQISGFVHLVLLSNLSEIKPKKMFEENPNMLKTSELMKEYSALNNGKFTPKNTGRK